MKRFMPAAVLLALVSFTDASAAALEGALTIALDAAVIVEGQDISGSVASSLQADSIQIRWVNGYGETIFATVLNVSGGAQARFTFRVQNPATRINFVTARSRGGTASVPFTVVASNDTFWRGFVLIADSPPSAERTPIPANLALAVSGALCLGRRECLLAGQSGLRPVVQGLVSPGVLELGSEAFAEVRERYRADPTSAALIRDPSLSDVRELARLRLEAGRQAASLRAYAPGGYLAAESASVTRGNAVLDLSFASADLEGFRRFVATRFATPAAVSAHWGEDINSMDQIMPKTAVELREAISASPDARLDISPWALHREYMDARLAASVMDVESGIAAAAGAAGSGAVNWGLVKPRTGFGGGRAPCAYGGSDWSLLAGISDFVIMDPDAPRWAWNLARDINRTARVLVRIDSSAADAGDALWDASIAGMAGVVLDNYDDYLESAPAVAIDATGGEGRARGASSAGLAQARSDSAAAAEVIALSPRAARLALVYSPQSVRAGWMMRYLGRVPENAPGPEGGTEALAAWNDILRDLGADFQWVSTRDVELGALLEGRYTAAILPECWCLSAQAVSALGAFCNAGGSLIADNSAGLLDDDYRAYRQPPGDTLFGIAREALTNAGALHAGNAGAVSEDGLQVSDAALKVTGGAKASRSDPADVEIVRPLGRGGAIYLNLILRDYPAAPAVARAHMADAVKRALDTAGFAPEVRVSKGAEDVPSRVRSYYFGRTRIFVIEVPQAPDEDDRPLEVAFAAPAFIYNLRPAAPEGQAYGAVRSVRLTMPESGPIILAATDQEITGLPMEAEFDGRAFYIRATLTAAANPGARLFRVDFFAPSGRRAPQLSRTVSAESATALLSVNVPLDAPVGAWRVLVRDLATGMASWRGVIVSR